MMSRLPPGTFFLIDHTEDSPECAGQFTLNGPAGEVCLPVFTTWRAAGLFLQALRGDEWEVFSVPRESPWEFQ